MAKRKPMRQKAAKRYFSQTAQRVHPKNNLSSAGSSFAMRGGIRLT